MGSLLSALRAYVGVVSGQRQTVARHWAEYCAGKGTPKKLGAALAQYGPACWRVVVLKRCRTFKKLEFWERRFVQVFDSYTNGYNGSNGGAPTWGETSKRMWEDPGLRAEIITKMAENSRRRWEEPEYRAKMSAHRKRLGQDPAYHANLIAGVKRGWQNSARRANASKHFKSLWQTQRAKMNRWEDPEYRAKLSATHKRRLQDPEVRAKLSATHKRRWKDPELRARYSATMRHKKQERYRQREAYRAQLLPKLIKQGRWPWG